MSTRTARKSATGKPLNRNVQIQTLDGETVFRMRIPASTWDPFCELVPDSLARGAVLEPIIRRKLAEMRQTKEQTAQA
jgi:hypothetical protein